MMMMRRGFSESIIDRSINIHERRRRKVYLELDGAISGQVLKTLLASTLFQPSTIHVRSVNGAVPSGK